MELQPLDPREVFASRLRETREAREWSLRTLAGELAQVGYPLDHMAIFKIEKGTRNVMINDVFALAFVLGRSPLDLLTPNDSTSHPEWPDTFGVGPLARPVRVVPRVSRPAGAVRTWLRGFWPIVDGGHNREVFFGEAPFEERDALRTNALQRIADGEDGLPAPEHYASRA